MPLTSDHLDALSTAVESVLSTEIAEITYAQILDGLPMIDVFRDRYSSGLDIRHPLYEHTSLCPGVLERMRKYGAEFDAQSLNYDDKLVEAFQRSSPGSKEFHLRLIEMVAVAVHQIAVLTFDLDESLHKNDGVTSWEPPKDPRASPLPSHLRDLPSPITLFYHTAYSLKERYPNGIGDMVGYWAENRILGGVVLFDRGESGFECKDIYFHSDRQGVTFRIYKLLDDQVQALIDFLLDSSSADSCPLPTLGDKCNRDRVDPDDAIDEHGIFRDRWEREVPVKDFLYRRRQRCTQNALDYPEVDDEREAMMEYLSSRQ
ncbi:hypothetical protein NM208_g1782 [Fusarium decemcellulare]|uniref:Uncharacterized protein n=1 Tax=Fusarium decemcellulare TaxID=57161 RepID=A0ACC1SV11_9HYPO|nr:hypothetical protein NM208_g1782 [Fusarium decemcellulare]